MYWLTVLGLLLPGCAGDPHMTEHLQLFTKTITSTAREGFDDHDEVLTEALDWGRK